MVLPTETINTVMGKIAPQELGPTLVHEHMVLGYPGWYGHATIAPFDRKAALDDGIALMRRLKEHGVQTYVDATTNDMGRNPLLYKEVSDRTGMNIICVSGYYFEHQGASAYFGNRSTFADAVGEIEEMFVTEVTLGIEGTGIRAGAIKVASGAGRITAYERMFFEAAARAQRKTGVPIITHTQAGTMGPQQADLLITQGVDPGRIMVGHMDYNPNLRYHLQTLQRGVFSAFDQMGIEGVGDYPSDTERCACLLGLIGGGHAGRLMLSSDFTAHWLGKPEIYPAAGDLPALSHWHPTQIFEKIIPTLIRAGVTRDQLNTILVENPRSLFGAKADRLPNA